MGLKERRERDKQELRAKILNAARCIFAEKGYHSVTIRDIAKLTEYSVPTLYSYFKDKESLMIELVANDISEIQRMSIASAMEQTSAEDQLRVFGLASLQYLLSHPEQFRFLFKSFLPNVAEDAVVTEAIRHQMDTFVRDRLETIVDRKLTDAEAQHYRLIFVSNIHGLVSLVIGKMQTCCGLSLEALYNTKWEMFVNYLKLKRGTL